MTFAAVANQASCFALAFLGRDPQRPGVPPAHRASLRLRAHQKEGHDLRSCPSFWVPAASGRLHPSVFECSGSAKPPLRNSRPAAGNLRATRRAAQTGRWAVLLQQSCPSKISILTVPSTSSRTSYRSRRRFLFQGKRHRSFTPSLLLSDRDPLRWAAVGCRRRAAVLSAVERISILTVSSKKKEMTCGHLLLFGLSLSQTEQTSGMEPYSMPLLFSD